MPYKNLEITNNSNKPQNTVQTSQFYRGFSSVNNASIDTRLYDFDIVKQDIINQFNTKKGERIMNPAFGSIIWNLLMEPLTENVKTILVDDITRICNSDPRVTVLQIDLNEYEQGYLLELTLALKVTNQADKLLLNFNQEVGLQLR
jgi:phage baseplate assembly protein W